MSWEPPVEDRAIEGWPAHGLATTSWFHRFNPVRSHHHRSCIKAWDRPRDGPARVWGEAQKQLGGGQKAIINGAYLLDVSV
jgi:hypothetical protein